MLLPITLLLLAQSFSATSPPSANVRVTTRIVAVEQGAFTRAGLEYVVIGHDRVRVGGTPRRGVRVQIGTHGVSAFLEAVRASKWIRSESTQSVLTMSGSAAQISSHQLTMNRRSARTSGPSMQVLPTVLEDGRVRLFVSAGIDDRADYRWGRVDGSPVATESEIIVRPGEEVILASSSAVQTSRASGILHWSSGEESLEVLVAVTVDVE